MKKLYLIILSQLISIVVLFSQEITYDEFYKKIIALENEGNYTNAKELAEKNIDKFQVHWFETSKEILYINEKLGNYAENIELFKLAHEKGLFYFLHPQMPKYGPYKGLPDFDTISKVDLQLRNAALEQSKTIYRVQLPENYNENGKYPAIFILHGGGKSISESIGHWQAPSLNQNYVKIYLQSYRHFDFNSFGWGTNDPRLDNDIKKICTEIIAFYPIDTAEILISGISAGASAAIDIALRGVIPVKGFIAYCPDLPSFLKNNNFSLLKNTKAVGYISSGENDHFLPRQELMLTLLDSLGIRSKLVIDSCRGHEYPENEGITVKNAIHFLNSKTKP
ncbi:MAG TPA: hypothetical protein PL017_09210 [Tenuifilaceae bacterium]|nr:hypothetical protein [Tenuifilaceae bacterium]